MTVDESLVSELISGEQDRWYDGVCTLVMGDDGDKILVYGEGNLLIEPVSIHVYYRDGPAAKRKRNLTRIAEAVNDAIKSERSEL